MLSILKTLILKQMLKNAHSEKASNGKDSGTYLGILGNSSLERTEALNVKTVISYLVQLNSYLIFFMNVSILGHKFIVWKLTWHWLIVYKLTGGLQRHLIVTDLFLSVSNSVLYNIIMTLVLLIMTWAV